MRLGPDPRMIDALAAGVTDLVLLLVGGVVVRREGLELGRAGVDRLERRPHPVRQAGAAHIGCGRPAQVGQLRVGEPQPLGPAEVGRAERRRRVRCGGARPRCGSAGARTRDRCRSGGPPLRRRRRGAAPPRARRPDRAWRRRCPRAAPRRSASSSATSDGSALSPARPCSSERSAFWSDSQKVRPMAMTSPTDCIRVPRRPSAPGSFSKAQRGILVTT